MKPALFTLLLLSMVALIRYIKGDLSFPAARMLPFCDGIMEPAYTFGGIIMLLMLIYAIIKLKKRNKD